jgi:hypothetical protein
MTPTGAIPFADLKLGETVWTCEHPNGADHDAHALFERPPVEPTEYMVTEPQTGPHGNVTLCRIAPDNGKPIHGYHSSVTLFATRQFAFRDKAACVAYYREAMATWARQTREAVDAAMTTADAYLANEVGG